MLPMDTNDYGICAVGFGSTELFVGTLTQVSAWYTEWYNGNGATVNVG